MLWSSMATTQENHEVTDPVQSKSDINGVETESLKASDEQPVISSPTDIETPNKETLCSEQADTQLAEELLGSETQPEVLNEVAETQQEGEDAPSSEHAETQRLDDVAETQGLDDVAETQELDDVAETQPMGEDAPSSDHPEADLSDENAETKGLNEQEELGSELAEAHPMSNEAMGSEQAEIEPTSTESLGIEQTRMDLVREHPMDSEPADPEPSNIEPVNSELADQQPSSVEMVNSYHDGSEQSVMYEAVHSGGSEHAALQPVDESTQPDAHNAAVGTECEDMVNTETVNVDTMGLEHVGSEHGHHQQYSSALVHSEDVSSEQVGAEGEPMNVDIPHQVSDSELAYSHSDVTGLAVSQSMSSDLGHMQPDGSELVGSQHVEYVDSQSYDHENHSAMYHMETIHEKDEYVKMEHSHPESMHEDAVNAELEDQLQMSSELMHELQGTSELAHQLHVTPDLVHMQSIGSEIVHSQPMNSDLVHSEPYVSEFDTSPNVGSDMANMQLVATEMVNSEFPDPEIQPSKRRKKKSIVWEHFTIETVGVGCRRACCKVCKQSFAYSTGSKVAGTSHLKRHIAKGSCPLLLRQQDKNQITPYAPKSAGTDVGTPASTDPPKRRYRTSSAPYLIFDQDRCRHEIARMIIMHEYPLQMVEHSGFVSFVQNLQPRFDMVNFSTVQGDCVATYLREKQNLQKIIDGMPGRICLSVDMWTSCQTTGYVFLHCQFIDQEFVLQRRLLNVVMEPFPESDNAFSHAVATCLSYWNLDNKLCSITFSQPLSDVGRENMRGLLSVKNPSTLNGQLLLGNCLSRTLSGMAQDVLAAGQDVVRKIRSSVKYVKTSDAHEDKFLEFKQQLQVPSDKTLTLDNITKWNTTYDMLVAACELKEVFPCLDTSDHEYKDSPTMDDWIQAENVCMYLRILYETANFLIEKVPPSTNVFFHEVWKIQLELTRNASSEDPFVRSLASTLQEKFLNYWRGSFLVLAIAVAMDPRFKMKLVEFSFAKLFSEEAPAYIRMADEGIHGLFHEYMALSGEVNGGLDADGNQAGSLVSSNGLTDFDMYIMETTSQQMKSELDEYLDESLLPRMQELDVIGWWKLNRIKYPTLSKMARDILSIPLSSVGPSYVFDTVSRDMDPQWSSLRPETMEALMCAKDWLSV
ncbi:hypothetical protein V2J09_002857 [Rumex salicifolius]